MSFRLAAIGTCVAAGVFLFYIQAPAMQNMQEEGDTYGPAGGAWRGNTMARITDPLGSFNFTQMMEGPDGNAKELIRSAKVPGFEWTVIPIEGISLGDRMVLHYMSVRMWTSDGHWLSAKS